MHIRLTLNLFYEYIQRQTNICNNIRKIGEWKGCDLDNQYEIYTFYENKTGIYINLSTCENMNFHWMYRNSEWITSDIIYPSNGDISTFYMVTATNIFMNNGSFYKIEIPN